MTFQLTYMSGAGNLFSVLDGRQYNLSTKDYSNLAPVLCRLNESNSFETEGLIIINESQNGLDFQAEFFNPDGSWGAMCGNGSRCAVNFARRHGFFDKIDGYEIVFFMAGSVYRAVSEGSLVSVFFPPPLEIRHSIDLEVDGQTINGGYVNVGSDHFVVNVNDVPGLADQDFDSINLKDFAFPLRWHKYFSPRGVNVNIFKLDGNDTLLLRTFERGVEAETGACGTGSISTAIISGLKHASGFPVNIIPTSKDKISVDIRGSLPNAIEHIKLTGNALFLDTVEIKTFH